MLERTRNKEKEKRQKTRNKDKKKGKKQGQSTRARTREARTISKAVYTAQKIATLLRRRAASP